LIYEGVLNGGIPGPVAEDVLNLAADVGKTLEKKLRNVGERDGIAVRDAVLGDKREESAKDMVDIAGGLEFARKGDELASGLIRSEELLFAAGVENTKGAVLGPARHAAGASVGEGELTKAVPRWLAGSGSGG
jgi:hypothetical protein